MRSTHVFGFVFAFALALAALVPASALAQTSCSWFGSVWNSAQCGTGMLTVNVLVNNRYDSARVPGDFAFSVAGNNPSPASFLGSQSGTVVALGAGPYRVSASGNMFGYEPSYSTGCDNTIAGGQSSLCVITMNATYGPTAPVPYSGPYPYSQPLLCHANTQQVPLGATALFTATGGVGTYNWITADRSFVNIGPRLSTAFTTSGLQTVTVSSGGQSAACVITVLPVYAPNAPVSVQPAFYPAFPNTGFMPGGAAGASLAALMLLAASWLLYPYVRKAAIAVTR